MADILGNRGVRVGGAVSGVLGDAADKAQIDGSFNWDQLTTMSDSDFMSIYSVVNQNPMFAEKKDLVLNEYKRRSTLLGEKKERDAYTSARQKQVEDRLGQPGRQATILTAPLDPGPFAPKPSDKGIL